MRRQLVTTETSMNPSWFPKNDIGEHNREPVLQSLEKLSNRFSHRQQVLRKANSLPLRGLARGSEEHMPVDKVVNEEVRVECVPTGVCLCPMGSMFCSRFSYSGSSGSY